MEDRAASAAEEDGETTAAAAALAANPIEYIFFSDEILGRRDGGDDGDIDDDYNDDGNGEASAGLANTEEEAHPRSRDAQGRKRNDVSS